jgi:hypothetical protein
VRFAIRVSVAPAATADAGRSLGGHHSNRRRAARSVSSWRLESWSLRSTAGAWLSTDSMGLDRRHDLDRPDIDRTGVDDRIEGSDEMSAAE